MKEYDATEIAFKNGYEKAVREIFEEIEKALFHLETPIGKYLAINRGRLTNLKKKYTEDKNE